MAESTCTATALVADIFRELDRLRVSINQNYQMGLNLTGVCTGDTSLLRNDRSIVKIYDDQESGYYDADSLLAQLQSLPVGEVNLMTDSPANIWQFLNEFELWELEVAQVV